MSQPFPPQQPTQPFFPPASGPPDHPKAMTALVLGIIGMASILMCCGLGLFLSPFAWVMGSRVVREIDASGGAQGGRGNANIGRILGIVGTVAIPFVMVGAFAYAGLMTYDVLWEIRDGEFTWTP